MLRSFVAKLFFVLFLLCASAPALAQSESFRDCLSKKDPTKLDEVPDRNYKNCNLVDWLTYLREVCKEGSGSLTPAELAEAVCAFYAACPPETGTSCSALIAEINAALCAVYGRMLTPADLHSLAQCLQCSPTNCTGTGGGLTATCSYTPPCGGSSSSACDALQQTLRDAAFCFFKGGGGSDAAYQTAMGKAVCAFLTQCSSSGMNCQGAVNCIAGSAFSTILGKSFFCTLMSECSACKTELCGADGTPESGHTRCDLNGDNKIDCEDLKMMIALLEACRCANSLPPPTAEDIASLACKFYAAGGCIRSGEGSVPGLTTVECSDIAKCLQEITAIPAAQYCAIMNGSCSGVSGEPGCASTACSLLGSSPDYTAICAEIARNGLEGFLRTLKCCSGADSLTEDQWATILCALADHCGLSCSDVAHALSRVFGYTKGKAIFDKFRACHAGCSDFDDELLKYAAKKRGKGGGTKGCNPVEFATGEKLEYATDVSVALPGGVFVLQRSYSSELAGTSGTSNDWSKSVFGAEWTMPVAQFIVPSTTTLSSATWVKLHGESANEYRQFNYDSGSSTFKADTGAQSYVELLDEQILFDDGTTTDWVAVWRLTEPGIGTREYVAGSALSHTTAHASYVAEHAGLLFRETSIHGRRDEYVYSQYGTFGTALRPDTIYLAMFGTETRANARARVVFNWSFDTASKGRLARIDVLRPSGSSDVLTNQVEYRYKLQDVSESGVANDVGKAGDLIQVVTRELTDSVDGSGAPIYQNRVTQYRYHDGITSTPSNTVPLNVDGAVHQLKAVFMPEQLEYLAQKLFETSPGGSQPDTVENVATALLANADSDTVLTGSETRIAMDFAAKVVGYNLSGNQKVAVQFLQASCGCSGAAQGVKEAYAFLEWTGGSADYKTAIVREYTENGSGGYTTSPFRVTRHDLKLMDDTPYLLSKAVSATLTGSGSSTDGATWWVWAYRYDSNKNLTHEFMPSSIDSYNIATSSVVASFAIKNPSSTSSPGLVQFYSYNSENRVTEKRTGSGNTTTASDYTLVEKTTYLSGSALTSYLPTKVERYSWPNSTTASHVETVDYDYGFRTSPDLAWVKTTYEAELSGNATSGDPVENGPDGTYQTFQLINSRGQTDWSRAEDFAVRGYTYDDLTGAVLTTSSNVDSSGIITSNYGGSAPSITGSGSAWGNANGGGTRLAGGTLTTTYTVDSLGRNTSTARPAGSGTPVTTRTVRQMLVNPARSGVLYFATVDLPHRWTETSVDKYGGPATISWENARGTTIAASDYAVTFSTSAPASYTKGTQLSKSTVTHALTGAPLSSQRWRDVTTSAGDSTTLSYDPRGHVDTKTSPNGTIERYTYDMLDRVISVSVGTNAASSGGNMRLVSETFFDFDTTSSGAPAQGIGDGNATLTRLWFGDGTGDYRDHVHIYDQRDRLVQVRGARDSGGSSVGPHEVRAYDNLDRPVERAMFTSLTGLTSTQGSSHLSDIAESSAASNRTLYARTRFSQRGLSVRIAVATSPTLSLDTDPQTRNTTALTSELVSTVWYDAAARVLGRASPNSASVKSEYDGHGRLTRSFVTDRDGATVSSNSSTGDLVAEQTNYSYDDRDRISFTARYMRRHDDTTTRGPLDASGVTAVKMFAGVIYDGADRVIKSVNLGTNVSGNATLTAGGSTPGTWPPSSLPSYPDAIIESRAYNARGLTAWTEDALGRKTRFKYDDLARQVAVIENATIDPDNSSDIQWDGSLDRWKIVNTTALASTATDQNRMNSSVFDGSGNVVKQIAHNLGSGTETVQITQYVFGVTAGSASNPMDSLLASNDVLREVRYPQESGTNAGQPGGSTDYNLMVRYAYNRLGELRATTDQNGTRHDYSRDVAGRVTLDVIGVFGTDIDQAVKSIGVTYDTTGRLREVISASDVSGATPVNGVAFSYTGLWQLSSVKQNHTGAALTSGGGSATGTKSVSYSYLTTTYALGNESNFSRLYQTTYPDAGTVLTNSYGNGSDGRLSRVSVIRINPAGSSLQELVKYQRLGLNTPVVVDYPVPDVQLDYTFSHSDRKRNAVGITSQTSGTYPGYDGFGRIVRHPWLDGAVSDASGHNRPAIIEHVHGYDAASNRLSKLEGRTGAPGANRDWEYTYDALNRLNEAKRGVRGSTWTTATGSQQWVLDMLGNWATRRTDLGGNGVYTDSADRSEVRNHNQANELTQRATTTSGTTVTLPLSYDDAGNAREEQLNSSGAARRYTHDAWGRLVKVENKSTSGGSYYTSAEYAYNGLHWRTSKGVDYFGGGTIDRRVKYWYDASWRVVQEDHADIIDDNPADTSYGGPQYKSYQQVWGVRYIDEVVARLQLDGPPGSQTQGPLFFQLGDAQFSVSALLDESGMLVDRMRYTPYGEVTRTSGYDVTANGIVDSSDYDGVIDPLAAANSGTGTPITDGGYNADADIDRDGDVDYDDYNLCASLDGLNPNSVAVGTINFAWVGSGGSEARNDIGYCGYVQNEETGHYIVRFRHYSPQLGRWLERDPAGYVDGMSQSEYARGSPVSFTDPLGLSSSGERVISMAIEPPRQDDPSKEKVPDDTKDKQPSQTKKCDCDEKSFKPTRKLIMMQIVLSGQMPGYKEKALLMIVNLQRDGAIIGAIQGLASLGKYFAKGWSDSKGKWVDGATEFLGLLSKLEEQKMKKGTKPTNAPPIEDTVLKILNAMEKGNSDMLLLVEDTSCKNGIIVKTYGWVRFPMAGRVHLDNDTQEQNIWRRDLLKQIEERMKSPGAYPPDGDTPPPPGLEGEHPVQPPASPANAPPSSNPRLPAR